MLVKASTRKIPPQLKFKLRPMSTPFPRSQRNFTSQLDFLVKHLAQCHHRICSGEDLEKQYAFQDLSQIIAKNDDHETEDLMEIVRQAIPEEMKSFDDSYLAATPMGPVIIALTYAYRALKAYEEQHDTELSWSFLTDCSFWSGYANTARGLVDVSDRVRKELATKGAKAKNKHHVQMRDDAYQFVRDHCPPDGWKSVTSAVVSIAKAFKQRQPPAEVDTKTIYNWLADMPDRSPFLPEKRRPRTKP